MNDPDPSDRRAPLFRLGVVTTGPGVVAREIKPLLARHLAGFPGLLSGATQESQIALISQADTAEVDIISLWVHSAKEKIRIVTRPYAEGTHVTLEND